MKFSILLLASTGVLAQLPGLASLPPGSAENMEETMAKLGIKCLKELPNIPDPMRQFPPQKVQWPCDFGKPVPYGKIPKGCAKFEVLVARGTSEPGPFGMVIGDPLVARVIKAMPGQTVRGYPVQYPAGNVAAGGTKNMAALLESLEAGPKDITNRITSQLKQCPDTRFAMVGYNQGASAISIAATRLNEKQLAKVDAVVTYGADTAFPKALEKKWLNNCAPGDMCGGNTPKGNEAHLSYNNEGTVWHDRSAKYIADAFKGKSQGYVNAKTPKK